MRDNIQHFFPEQAASERKQAIAHAFSRAARHYDQHAAFQRDTGNILLAGLPADLQGYVVLDVGCGTGYFSEQLKARGAEVICIDLSSSMLDVARQRCGDQKMHYHLCDAEALCLPDNSVDFVFSNLALQWCKSLSVPLKEIKRVLKPGGQGVFSTLTQGSLDELRQAWQVVDSGQHVNRFISQNQVKIALAQAECDRYQIDLRSIRLWYDSALALMKDLKGIGATHVDERGTGGVSRRVLTELESAYQTFSNQEGLLPATYQVCFGAIHR
ncbi:malonyl-ACP O-methyltransferase BioC [Vibrio quintilis]|uniref:Malonyl-[acyl-carrier protein] O-methyltransferase n=1 Tax=Vibrio quintilis TaxID=1117707 RepID=A0A1M7Z127_9VIBR|nr:malonyl-ACP O-methyltransferase BioC [Vibrio quintilis]SHO58544.1 Malonyl-[acyl-carrier protein] O-methyltransferase [Vibrio quintilis]